IRAKIRKEFCTSSGPSDAGGNPPPVTIHTWLERFNKQKPHSFEKAIAPTRLAVYKFEGNTLAWWKAYKQAKGSDAWLITVTWPDFKKLFFLQFFPRAEQERLKREYHSIRQTNTETSTEFMQHFLRLADKRQKSGDRHQPTSQQSSHRNHGHNNDRHGPDRRGSGDNHRNNNNYSGNNNRNSGNGHDQRSRGQQSNQSTNSEIREEFRTSSGLSDAGGNPPPVTIHTWLERFNKQKPYSFEKATAPVDAENWISYIEKIFNVMGCEDAFKTRLVVYKFEGNALAWWKAYKQAKAAGTDEEQAKNFQWGLHRSTLNHLMCMSYTDVAQVANAASNYEILHERDDDDVERPDKRQKSGDRHQPTSQQSSHMNHGHNSDRHGLDRQGGGDNHRSNNNYSGNNNRNSGNGRDQRNRGQQSNRYTNSGNSL
nr:hypothetical protein [Tanacetum cinerariifolium]